MNDLITIEDVLKQKYDEVLSYPRREIPMSEYNRLEDISLGQTICTHRNLHNGDTKNMKVRAKVEHEGTIYVAGDHE